MTKTKGRLHTARSVPWPKSPTSGTQGIGRSFATGDFEAARVAGYTAETDGGNLALVTVDLPHTNFGN